MIITDTEPKLTLTFRVDSPQEAEELHRLRALLGAATDIEALDEDNFLLHVWPRCCVSCGVSPEEEAE